MSAQSAGDSGRRRLDIADRVKLAFVGTLITLGVIAFVAFLVVMFVNTRYNFQTLRADLARIHIPSGYHLVTVRRSGTDCAREQCSLTETWTWPGNGGRTVPAACSAVYQAMTTAYSEDAEANSPMAAGAACDYYSIAGGPGATKALIEVIVRPDKTQSAGGVLVQLTGSYPS
jgi:hypothetical protein